MQVGTPEDAKSGLYIAVALATASPRHRNWTVADIERLFWPPIIAGQCLVAIEDDKPVGFMSWAFLSEDVATGFANRTRILQADEWASGEQLWIIDLIAPFGHCKEFVRFAIEKQFPGQVGFASRLRPSGERGVAKFIGKDVKHA